MHLLPRKIGCPSGFSLSQTLISLECPKCKSKHRPADWLYPVGCRRFSVSESALQSAESISRSLSSVFATSSEEEPKTTGKRRFSFIKPNHHVFIGCLACIIRPVRLLSFHRLFGSRPVWSILFDAFHAI